ncbi:MAG: UPF0158 family protein [Pseudonocardiaceae bacterium]
MPVEEWRAQLRGAVYRGDGRAVVALARTGLRPDDRGGAAALQLIGDGLISALAGQVDGAPELAADCVSALSERGWYGDTELVEHLQALLGTGPTPMLRSLPIDLEELAGILEGDPIHGGGRVDVRTGEVWPRAAIDYAQEIGKETEEDEDEERWLWVVCEGSREGYRDMEAFIESLADPDRADRLWIAIQGRGAFRRFKDVLGRTPDELDRWFAFSEERQRGRARAWLADAGYRPSPRPPCSPAAQPI